MHVSLLMYNNDTVEYGKKLSEFLFYVLVIFLILQTYISILRMFRKSF